MDKLRRTARGLDVFFKIIFWLAIALGVLLLIADIAMLAVGGAGQWEVAGVFAAVEVDGLTYSLGDAAADGLPGAFIALSALFFVTLAFGLYSLSVIRRLLRPMKEGKPFESAVSRSLRQLGWLAVIYGVAEAGIEVIVQFVIVRALGVAEDAAVHGLLDLSWLVGAALLFLFSYIFRYGEELQRQADETL